jgi:hypothetical protein
MMKAVLYLDKMKCLFISYSLVNKFKCGLINLFLTEDVLHARRPKTATSVKMVANIKEIVKPMQDAMNTRQKIVSLTSL